MSLDIAQYARSEAKVAGALPWPDGLPDHLSASQLAMAQRCLEQYRCRYVLGMKERPAEAPLIGTAVHSALEINYGQKIESHEDMSTAELLDWYSEVGFPRAVVEAEQKAETEAIWDTDPEKARTRGRLMLGAYHSLVSPRVQPLSVEGSFSVDLGAPVFVVGRYDVQEMRQTIDVKTGQKKQTKPKDHWKVQGATYNIATGKPVAFHSLTATKVKSEVSIVTPLESEELLVNLSEPELLVVRENVRWIAAQIALCMETYGSERPWPVTGTWHSWACDWCGFRGQCPAWEHER